MTPLDDAELGAQLCRRGDAGARLQQIGDAVGAARDAMRLADLTRAMVAEQAQVRARPWERFPMPRLPHDWAGPRRLAALAVAVVVVAIAAGLLPSIAGGPAPSSTGTTWFLTRDQLERVVADAGTDTGNVGKTIVADVTLSATVTAACPFPSSGFNPACPVNYVIAGATRVIRVDGVPAFQPPCPPGVECVYRPTFVAPLALTILGPGLVSFVGEVLLPPSDPTSVWSVAAWRQYTLQRGHSYRELTATDLLFPVAAWMSGAGGVFGCPAPIAGSTADPDFGCGPAAWLTDQPYQPTVANPTGNGMMYSTTPPPDGIRVQNAAYETFAPDRPASGQVVARQGIFLIRPTAVPDEECFACAPGPRAKIVDRIDPVTIPPPSTASPTKPALPTIAPPTSAGWLLDQPALVAAVRDAQASSTGVGRTVVADVTFELGGDCHGTPNPVSCYPVVKGSDPPIRLLNATSSHLCPPGWFCPMESRPAVPADGPFALRLTADGTIDWVGWVGMTFDGHAAWTFPALRTQLARFSPDQIDAYKLQVVSGWISGAFAVPRCLSLTGEDARFDCGSGAPAWLTANPVQPNGLSPNGWQLIAPSPAIRIQNGAYAAFAPDPTTPSPSTVPESRFGVFLVMPVLPAPSSCQFCDHPAVLAEVVARLDPP